MKRWLTATGLILALTLVPSFAATGTWVGKIGDTMCGAKHKQMEVHSKKIDDRACTETCVAAGAKYNFVSQGKAFEISNQNFAGLAAHAGHTVRLTGSMSTDGKSVAVTKIAMPGITEGTAKTKGY
ncbi:MAG: hypothetical protein ACR2L2_20975 [Acidobacteriota bacterium]